MRVSLSTIFETSKLLATKSGKELAELVDTFANFVKQVVPVLQNGITFADNINGEAKVIQLSSEVEQAVSTADDKVVTDVIVGRVISDEHLLAGFAWWFDASGELIVKAKFDPAPDDPLETRLLVFYA